MPESMRRNVFSDTCFFREVLDDIEDHYPAQTSTPSVEKNNVLISFFWYYVGPDLFPIYANVFDSTTTNGNQSFFIPFSNHADVAHVEIEIRELKIHYLAHTKSATIHSFKNCFVPAIFVLT